MSFTRPDFILRLIKKVIIRTMPNSKSRASGFSSKAISQGSILPSVGICLAYSSAYSGVYFAI